jgi:uncharacterized membrane protein
MANILAYFFGGFALLLALIAFIPLLGWMNWFIIPIAAVGAICGAVSSSNSGRNFCFIVIGICALRLWLGGGLF